MKEILKQLITDFHQTPLPKVIPRQADFPHFPQNIRKAHIFVGMRRSGKTWLMYQHIQQQLQANVSIEKILYLNFEDDRLISFKSENLQDITTAYFDLYPQYGADNTVTFYFDEIHLVPGWEKFIRRLLDKEKMQIYVTGSSAKMLSKEIATNLRGRSFSTEVFPFSFKEYLSFHDFTDKEPLSTKSQSLLRNYCWSYLQAGGFPETLFIPKEKHRELLQEYVSSVIFRDIIDRYQISNSHAVKLFLLHCLQNLSSPLTITKVYNALKSNGISIGKNSLYEYLDYFLDSYLLFAVSLFDLSLRKRQVNPKKIYAVDTGIFLAYSINPAFRHGPLFENAVFLQLRRQYADIFYYKTKNNKEIDFVIMTPTGMLQLYQCCLDLSAEKTKQRELSALLEAAEELKTTELFIITLDTEDNFQTDKFEVRVLPFWKWARS